MTERRPFLYSMMKVIGAVSLACGLVACSTYEQGAADEQARLDLANSRSPKGRYIAQIRKEVREKWDRHMNALRNSPQGYGTMVVEFYVTPKGKVEDLRIINTKNCTRTFATFTLQAIREVKLPPMPAEVVAALTEQDGGRLRLEYYPERAASERAASESGVQKVASPKKPVTRFSQQVRKLLHNTYEPYIRQGSKGPDVFHIKVVVDFNGKVEHAFVTDEMGNNEKLRVLTQKLIYAAKLPPIPEEVIPLLPKETLEHLILNYDVVIN